MFATTFSRQIAAIACTVVMSATCLMKPSPRACRHRTDFGCGDRGTDRIIPE